MTKPYGKLIHSGQARDAKRQHKTPCSDCPWRRDSLPGWLGGGSALEWLTLAHGDTKSDPCHTRKGMHCAGVAIYRANVCKTPRDPDALKLPKDTKLVFASQQEFYDHHTRVQRS